MLTVSTRDTYWGTVHGDESYGTFARIPDKFCIPSNFVILGFEKPSAIQQRAIRPLLKGRDVIAQAQSGTGKTATFSISILQSIDTTVRETQVTY